MKRIIYSGLYLLLCIVAPVVANDSIMTVAEMEQQDRVAEGDYKTLADEAYANGDYNRAIELYEQILETQGESAEIYYNLGNGYYKNSEIAKAILNYERAMLLEPGDADVRFNLDLAKSKTVDKITPRSEMFFVVWIRNLVNIQSSDAWARFAIFSFMAFVVCALLYLFNRKIRVRKIAFYSAIFFLLFCIVANFSSDYQKDKLVNQKSAIVMSPSVTVKSTPDMSGTDLFVLHEGCKVEIKDNSMQKWKEIELEDGSVGWMPSEALEII